MAGAAALLTQVVSNKTAKARSSEEITHRANEARLQHQHEVMLDERRAARAMRQEVYPKIAEVMQHIVSRLSENALAATSENSETPEHLTIEPPEAHTAWRQIVVFGSDEMRELFADCLKKSTELNSLTVQLRRALEFRSKGVPSHGVVEKTAEVVAAQQ